MSYDLDTAAKFLSVLSPTEPVTFQTFSDREELKHPNPATGKLVDPNARWYHSDLHRLEKTLSTHNQAGAGVYAMVNAGDGKGRRRRNVVGVRAVYIDTDGALYPDSLPLEPHLIVESSPGRWHLYWLVCDLPLKEFSTTQEALAARYGTDPSVKDLPRVMRLPGFYHCKGDPVRVRLLHAEGTAPYTRADLWHAWSNIPERLEARVQEQQARALPIDYQAPSNMSGRILKAAERHVSRVASEGVGRHRVLLWGALACLNNRLSEAEAEATVCALAQMLPSRGGHAVPTTEARDVAKWIYQNAVAGEPWRTSKNKTQPLSPLAIRRQNRWRSAKERHYEV